MSHFRTLTLLPTLLSVLLALVSASSAQSALREVELQTYALEVYLNGEQIAWDAGEGVPRNGELFQVEDPNVPLEVYFEGGRLLLDLADYGTFSRAHVTAVAVERQGESYALDATARYAGAGPATVTVSGADGVVGPLSLKRARAGAPALSASQTGVRASGEVQVGAAGGGSQIILDLSSEPFRSLTYAKLRYELERQDP